MAHQAAVATGLRRKRCLSQAAAAARGQLAQREQEQTWKQALLLQPWAQQQQMALMPRSEQRGLPHR
jgi:hypothetical protein